MPEGRRLQDNCGTRSHLHHAQSCSYCPATYAYVKLFYSKKTLLDVLLKPVTLLSAILWAVKICCRSRLDVKASPYTKCAILSFCRSWLDITPPCELSQCHFSPIVSNWATGMGCFYFLFAGFAPHTESLFRFLWHISMYLMTKQRAWCVLRSQHQAGGLGRVAQEFCGQGQP